MQFGLPPGIKLTKHPLVVWGRQSEANYGWAISHLQALMCERRLRWPDCKPHEFEGLDWTRAGTVQQKDKNLIHPPSLFVEDFSFPPQMVASECRKPPIFYVEAYRKYYKDYMVTYWTKDKNGKPMIAVNTWTNRGRPAWLA